MTGSTALAEVLPNLQELRTLNLGDCLVRDGGATAIAEAIKDGHKLLQVSWRHFVVFSPSSLFEPVFAFPANYLLVCLHFFEHLVGTKFELL